jgi:hypothetical protein
MLALRRILRRPGTPAHVSHPDDTAKSVHPDEARFGRPLTTDR